MIKNLITFLAFTNVVNLYLFLFGSFIEISFFSTTNNLSYQEVVKFFISIDLLVSNSRNKSNVASITNLQLLILTNY